IEHRMFSYITKNWRGRPLETREAVVQLISNTKTKTGLKIMAILDENEYKIKSDLGQQHETVIIDRQKQIKELTEKYGKRTYGSSCLNCKSFYLTKHLMSTRGDEPGKTIWFCLNCGHSFRRPNYVQKVGIDKPLSLEEK
ncbi:hypothetical protein LCGC14_1826340, partial [marine sediment metagenome]